MQTIPSLEQQRYRLIKELERQGITDTRVLAAFATVPRERFIPSEFAGEAYVNHALSIGWGQTISQPYIVGLMTQELRLAGGERVLEIGTGSGYQTAILATLGAEVFTIERVPELSLHAQEVLKSLGLERIHFRIGDGSVGWPEKAPFDGIIVTAASRYRPDALLDQLADGAALVIPLGVGERQTLWSLRKTPDGLRDTYLCDCRFVPLVTDDSEPGEGEP